MKQVAHTQQWYSRVVLVLLSGLQTLVDPVALWLPCLQAHLLRQLVPNWREVHITHRRRCHMYGWSHDMQGNICGRSHDSVCSSYY